MIDTVWFDPPLDETGVSWADCPLEDLNPQYDPANIWWKRVQDLTRTAVDRWQGTATVCHTDLGGNIDILASLRRTGHLLLDLHDSPHQVKRLCHEITGLWLRYYAELTSTILPAGAGTGPWAAIWSPGTCYMLQSDFSYMISPRMFEEFVLPDLETCCAAMDHPFYHLDGQGQIPHLDMLLSLHNLRGIQWVPGDGALPHHHWSDLLGRIRRAGKLCQMICSAESALAVTRALGGRGFAFQITDTLNDEEAINLVKLLCESRYE